MCAGEFADVWKVWYNGREVAAKVLRVPATGLEQARKVGCPGHVCINELIVARTAVLQGGCNMEGPSSSERAAIVGCHDD